VRPEGDLHETHCLFDPVQGAGVEDHVMIGGGVTICPGVTIGRGAFIGASALVNKDVPPGLLALGVPARHQPLPANIAPENLPELLLPQTDLFGAQHDDTWKHEPIPPDAHRE
jgi:hypothetical protein